MKRWIALLLVLVMALGLMGCGKSENAKKAEELIKAIGEVTVDSGAAITEARSFYDSLTEDEKGEVSNGEDLTAAEERFGVVELTAENWVNVNDGDSYSFTEDGAGKHDSVSVTYTRDGDKLAVTEGAGSTQARTFTMDRSGDVTRMIPEDGNGFYVRAQYADAIGKQVREENMQILTSQEFWKCTTQTGYYQFLEGGGGWLVLTGTTLSMTWEMLDNNTVKVHMEYNGQAMSSTLDIFNNNGNYSLVTSDGRVTWLPYSN